MWLPTCSTSINNIHAHKYQLFCIWASDWTLNIPSYKLWNKVLGLENYSFNTIKIFSSTSLMKKSYTAYRNIKKICNLVALLTSDYFKTLMNVTFKIKQAILNLQIYITMMRYFFIVHCVAVFTNREYYEHARLACPNSSHRKNSNQV